MGQTQTGATAEPVGLRERAKRERRRRILDGALDLLREDPSQIATVERIAERAEVAPMTVYNLIGGRKEMWAAMLERALGGLELTAVTAADPHQRARHIADAIVDAMSADAVVFGALLSAWNRSAFVLTGDPDPTQAFEACLREAMAGMPKGPISATRYAQVITTGLLGAIQQWTAGSLPGRAFRQRCRTIVDVTFTAATARPAD